LSQANHNVNFKFKYWFTLLMNDLVREVDLKYRMVTMLNVKWGAVAAAVEHCTAWLLSG